MFYADGDKRYILAPVGVRVGDIVVAAQQAYALTGQMPELMAVYHLFGDPAMKVAP